MDQLAGYLDIVETVLHRGYRVSNRTGVDTLMLPNQSYTVDLSKPAFPLLTLRSIPWKNVVIELLWYLRGDTNVAFLRKHGVRIWDRWADSDGEVKAGYGRHFRAYNAPGGSVDQIARLIEGLRNDPFSRRHIVDAWHPEEAVTADPPPCVTTQNYVVTPASSTGPARLHLHLLQRSGDLGIGVPHNLACYALLVHLLSRFTGIMPGSLTHTIVNAHLYCASLNGSNSEYCQIAAMTEVLRRQRFQDGQRFDVTSEPHLRINSAIQTLGDLLEMSDNPLDEILRQIMLTNYRPQPAVRMKPVP